ncbi:D-alanyl-D-alanine carboxypeptidase [Paenibacillus forsythiae]|uniref:D-alanyl-D-alanine carboxypeptidase n=1 Tax=Paenibacillus forsythiae TaxID=365616 RepID=A0ABU3H8S5_9BACL|nr:D-Ala-D-Ala carboxypeptidase VanY [Paenibacillus forsythiae]MDT3427226.1 D-alanyl-D-alanine carboxypeptidase [Paenibacillus forsythiae]
MKKWLLVLALLLTSCEQERGAAIRETNDQGGDIPAKVTEEQVYQGDLLLVNKEYSLHKEGIQPDIVKLYGHKEMVRGYALLDQTIRLSQRVAREFSVMIEAAEEDGVRHFMISSGYRSLGEQDRLYQEKGADYALPSGHSEHNLGLSLDIGSTKMEMNRAAEGKWLEKNAWKYGFILRYPRDKTEITGIQYEPWHFRYVGLPHSLIMKDKNFTLEEYLDYLKAARAISIEADGKSYEVSYVPISKDTVIYIREGRRYSLSGDNRGGVIVTTYR